MTKSYRDNRTEEADEYLDRIYALFAKIQADVRQIRWMLVAINLGLAYLIIKDLPSG